jgi:OPT family oligopeptide transporter
MMVTSGLLAFGLKWRTVLRAFGGLGRLVGAAATEGDDPLAHVEVPASWFVAGTLAAGTACVVLGHWLFGITWWMGILAVFVTFFLSIVAARATGETDITPIGAMGKITQLMYGVVARADITTNLMTASITAGAASHAADLLTDLKSGYLLGGNPRKQTISQLCGVIAGTLVSVPAYLFLVQRAPERLGSADLPAPSAKVWAGVAELLAKGIGALPTGAVEAIVVGGLLGIALTLLEEFGPRAWRPWLPSTTGLGIAGVIPAFNSFAMFAGALAAWAFARARPKLAATYTVPVSSGLIAGESLMGVAIILVLEVLKAVGAG